MPRTQGKAGPAEGSRLVTRSSESRAAGGRRSPRSPTGAVQPKHGLLRGATPLAVRFLAGRPVELLRSRALAWAGLRGLLRGRPLDAGFSPWASPGGRRHDTSAAPRPGLCARRP